MKTFLVASTLALLAPACATSPSVGNPASAVACDRATEVRSFRIDQVSPPADSRAANQIGFDLDGDGDPDDVAGTILTGMLEAYDDRSAYQDALDQRLASDVRWTIRIETCPSTGDTATTLSGDDGGTIPLGALADLGVAGGADAGWTPIDATRSEVKIGNDGTLTGRIGGGLLPGYREALAAAYAPYVSARLAAGQTDWGSQADANGDGVVTVDEVLADPTFRAITTPDLDLDLDGVRESLSFAFTIHATEIAR